MNFEDKENDYDDEDGVQVGSGGGEMQISDKLGENEMLVKHIRHKVRPPKSFR